MGFDLINVDACYDQSDRDYYYQYLYPVFMDDMHQYQQIVRYNPDIHTEEIPD
jgi:hypothetical protein